MNYLEKLSEKIIKHGYKINAEAALGLENQDLNSLLKEADRIRKHYKGTEVKLCSIVNAKSGDCTEDCKFCAQSSHNKAKIEKYPLLGFEKVEESFKKGCENKASCFGIVTSGRSLSENEIDEVCQMAEKLRGKKIQISVSLGVLEDKTLLKLKKSGINRIHHNIETSESYFPSICSTHTYQDKIKSILRAKKLGFEICSGVLFGLGESFAQRAEAAVALREIGASSIPMNFFNPIAGTALSGVSKLSEDEVLRTIAMFRFVLPEKDIRLCGGREGNLKTSQDKIFFAGANGMMVGGYLTYAGRTVEKDHKMITDCGMSIYGSGSDA